MKSKYKKLKRVYWNRQTPDGSIWVCTNSLAGEVGVQMNPEKLLSVTCIACGTTVPIEKHNKEWVKIHYLCKT
jgi:hypothetical protein